MGGPVELYLGEQFAGQMRHAAIGHSYGRLVLCPLCVRGTLLVGSSPGSRLSYDPEDCFRDYQAWKNPYTHIRRCPGVFSTGTTQVSTPEQIRIAEELSGWSKNEAGWDWRLFHGAMLQEGKSRCFVDSANGLVQGYAVSTVRDFRGLGRIPYLEDVFTFPPYRRKGVARRLMQAALPAEESRGLVGVSVPVRNAARSIIASLANERGAQILCSRQDGYWTESAAVFVSGQTRTRSFDEREQ